MSSDRNGASRFVVPINSQWAARIRGALNFLIVVVCALCFRAFVYEPFHVPSGSMKSTLLEGDYLFVEKFAYGYSRYSLPFHPKFIRGKIMKREPKRGDIVVFVPESSAENYYIKRLVGLPGDVVQVSDGVLYINHKPFERRFIDTYNDVNRSGHIANLNRYVEKMDNGRSYCVLQSKVMTWIDNTPKYIVPKGRFFVMGDNRDNSSDSRILSEVGYVPEENIVGRAVLVVFSLSPYVKWYKSLRTDRLFHRLDVDVSNDAQISRSGV